MSAEGEIVLSSFAKCFPYMKKIGDFNQENQVIEAD